MVLLREAKFSKRYWAVVQIGEASFNQLRVFPEAEVSLIYEGNATAKENVSILLFSSLVQENTSRLAHISPSLVLFLMKPSPPPYPPPRRPLPVAGRNHSSAYRSGLPRPTPSESRPRSCRKAGAVTPWERAGHPHDIDGRDALPSPEQHPRSTS